MTVKLIMTTADRDYFLKCIKTLCTGSHSDSTRTAQTLQDMLQSLPMVDSEPVEYLLGGMRVKLNFNKMGNMTSLADMEHDLQGRWVSFVGAENDKHLKATSPQALTPITADDVTDETLRVFLDALDTPMNYRATVASAYNAVINHRSEAK